MSSFEESLKRVLDPDGHYWRYPGDESDDCGRIRMIEQRLDVPSDQVKRAQLAMQKEGWQYSSSPDGENDDLHRLYFRKTTALTSQAKRSFLTGALRVAHETNGTLMSWINVEDYENN